MTTKQTAVTGVSKVSRIDEPRAIFRHIKSGKLYISSWTSRDLMNPFFVQQFGHPYGKAKSYRLTNSFVRIATSIPKEVR